MSRSLIGKSTFVAATFVAVIASSSASAEAAGGRADGRSHVVYPGQTLAMIAKRYNVTVDELCKANGITRRTPIRPKQRLAIPSRTEDGVVPAAIAKSRVDSDEDRRETRNGPSGSPPGYAKRPKKRGFISVESYTGSWRGLAVKDGKVTDAARTGLERVLASWRTGDRERINERLIRLLSKVSDHFGGRPLRIVSGYRPYSSSQHTPHSRHNSGHAVDFSVPGIPNRIVRDFCKTLPNVGVGFYPNSSFIHLDVRESSTYWVDFSGPGQAPRYADQNGRDPGEAQHAAEERDEPATGSGDGSSSRDSYYPNGI